ncbi:MAG: hypothetical protein IKO57_06815 [Treponema sp.]|nr:hypothetical protein [Treponema sp.]
MSLIEPKTKQTYKLNVGSTGKSYKLFIEDISSGDVLKIYDVSLKSGESYFITAPGTMPSEIASPDTELKESDTARRISIVSSQPQTKISYHFESDDTSILVEKNGEIQLGTTSDDTARSNISKQISIPAKGLTYANSAALKIVFTATKEGFVPQKKSVNAQVLLDSVRGFSFLEAFSLESIDF